ncbi:hypothetical protein AVEN_5225-1 [Araneus ventricosus]|uniref:Reverse transcriptase/retrotransposon-derived protein RNase H-like domain-containing protein n=1 Tax=Araneus ventricosus TaxID=182803 RepID=A0A4Y2I1U8_ARAVE|nr:hypothetical protein AVEN_5225-1 [Araneus ventricosus]
MQVNNFNLYTYFTDPKGPTFLIEIDVCGVNARVCADIGATLSITGERLFIPNFAHISRPLSKLTKKKVSWVSGNAEQSAFETLKKYLTSPVLKLADTSKIFYIRTDASSYVVGAVLLQGKGEEEHPIECASRLLNSADRNY